MAGKKKDTSLLHHLVGSRSLVWNLAKNDIKKKFAGSYFGVVWAFVQPVITVLLYWFVFEKGLNSKATDLRTGIEIPFVLWLTVERCRGRRGMADAGRNDSGGSDLI